MKKLTVFISPTVCHALSDLQSIGEADSDISQIVVAETIQTCVRAAGKEGA